jgi:hypothetical protein
MCGTALRDSKWRESDHIGCSKRRKRSRDHFFKIGMRNIITEQLEDFKTDCGEGEARPRVQRVVVHSGKRGRQQHATCSHGRQTTEQEEIVNNQIKLMLNLRRKKLTICGPPRQYCLLERIRAPTSITCAFEQHIVQTVVWFCYSCFFQKRIRLIWSPSVFLAIARVFFSVFFSLRFLIYCMHIIHMALLQLASLNLFADFSNLRFACNFYCRVHSGRCRLDCSNCCHRYRCALHEIILTLLCRRREENIPGAFGSISAEPLYVM